MASWVWIKSIVIEYMNKLDNIYSLSHHSKPVWFSFGEHKRSVKVIWELQSTSTFSDCSSHRITEWLHECSALVICSIYLILPCHFGAFLCFLERSAPGHCLLSVYGKEKREHYFDCETAVLTKCYRFETEWGRVNDDRIHILFVSGWSNSGSVLILLCLTLSPF